MNKYILTFLVSVLIIAGPIFCSIPKKCAVCEKVIPQQEQTIIALQLDNSTLQQRIKALEETLREERVFSATVTAYSPRTQETDSDPLITASMQPVREGTVAVSRDLFYAGWVFGRKIYIEGYGIFIITDLMHERKTQQIDIFMFSTKKALKFGKKQLRVALLG